MNPRTTAKLILAGLLFSLLSASVSMAAAGAEGNVRMSRIERADTVSSRTTAARHVQTFRAGDRSDSWLCEHVSVFFCSIIPTLPTTPDRDPAPPTPVRGRH